MRKCPEFPTFSAFLARLPLGAGDGVEERKDPSRDFSSVGSESSEGGRRSISDVKLLDHMRGDLVAEEGAVRGGFRVGWAPGGWGVRKKSELPLTCCLLTSAHSPSAFKFSSKFRKSQKMPLNIPTKEKLSKCWCKAGGL